MGAWYRILTKETKGHIRATGFEPIICLVPERSASAILVKTLAKRWWDITHTINIADREMMVTPYDFHRMTSLRCDGQLINLEGESGIQLGIDLLRRRFTTDTIRYPDIKVDYTLLPQMKANDCAKMARTFSIIPSRDLSLFQQRAKMSLRWLAPFCDFRGVRETNWGQACLAYLYFPLDTLIWGDVALACGALKAPLRLVFLPFIFCSSCIAIISIHVSFRLKVYIMLMQTVSMSSSCKLFTYVSCNCFSCKLTSCKLLSYFFLFNIGPCNTVSLLEL